jgi:PAS domain S-box-containing protein
MKLRWGAFALASVVAGAYWAGARRKRDVVRAAVAATRHASESAFNELVDEIPLLIWMHGPDGRIAYANNRWFEFVGVPKTSNRPPVSICERIVHPADLDRVREIFRNAIARRTTCELEVRIKPADADETAYRWVLARAVPSVGAFGRTRWIGIATDIHERKLAAEERDAQLRSLAEAVPMIVWRARPDGSADYFNSRWTELTGLTPAESADAGWLEALHPDDATATATAWKRAVRSRRPYEMESRFRDARHGGYRWFLARCVPQFDATGQVTCWLGSCMDIDDRKRSEANLRLLTETGARLIASLGVQESLDAVIGVLIAHDADWAAISHVDARATPRFVAIRHREPAADRRAAAVLGVSYGGPRGQGIAAAVASGVPHLWSRLPGDWLDGVPEPARIALESLGTTSALSVPTRVGHRVAALLTVGRGSGHRPFEDRDLPTYLEIARRLGVATKNAESYENERRVADSFQRAALPAELPRHPRISFDAVYEAGQSEALVGGDWYDAFVLGDGRVVVSIGDVSGNGLAAAVTMGLVRQSIRAAARIDPAPVAILDAADRTLRGDDPARIVTAFVGLLEPSTGDFEFAGAGHPPPLWRRPDGSIVELNAPGVPLGLRHRSPGNRAATVRLSPGSVVALYTDGLTEATRDVFEGERLLREALADAAVAQSDAPAHGIKRSVLRSGSRDDVAILTMTFREGAVEGPEPMLWSFAAADHAAAVAARHAFVAALREAGVPEARCATAELVFGELVSNATRHTRGQVDVRLEWPERRPVLHVLDEGPGYHPGGFEAADALAESGRGLFLVAMLAEDFNVTKRPSGGSHTRAVLACERRSAGALAAGAALTLSTADGRLA